MDRDTPVKPQQKVCKKNVDAPTILVEPLQEGGRPEVFVQWFGESSAGVNLREMQFRFPLSVPVDSHYWMGHPELCKIVMIGPARSWPNPEEAQRFADMVASGNLDALIVFIVATHYSRRCDGSRVGPACFAFELTVRLADGICGVITPQPYCNPSTLEEEADKIGDQTIDRNDLAEQLGEDF